MLDLSWSVDACGAGRGARLRSLHLVASLCALALAPASAAATEPPVLNVYNWADYIGRDTLAAFTAETGIRVNYDTYESSEIVEAKLLTGGTGYDLVVHGGQYSARLIPLGIFRPLDHSRLPNWKQLDPKVLEILANYDPGNVYAAPYMWGSTGFAYNVDLVKQRIPDAPLGSGEMIFDPRYMSKLADCGVSFLDSPTDVIPMALVYLGHDANTTDPEALHEVEAMLLSVRPYVKYFSSARILNDLPNREVCVAMSWSGDYAVARGRAADAGVEIDLAYTVPSEGSIFWFDGLFIPADAPHPENAHRFIDFVLRPEVIATISNATGYANAVTAARPLLEPEILADPAIYPTEEVVRRLQLTHNLPPKIERLRTRAFARVKAGR
jgi:putrescine transport system substrate-binding protein